MELATHREFREKARALRRLEILAMRFFGRHALAAIFWRRCKLARFDSIELADALEYVAARGADPSGRAVAHPFAEFRPEWVHQVAEIVLRERQLARLTAIRRADAEGERIERELADVVDLEAWRELRREFPIEADRENALRCILAERPEFSGVGAELGRKIALGIWMSNRRAA